jgi:hypothetical protein
MDELLDKLKSRIKALLEQHTELKQTHEHSQQKQVALTHEKKILQEKHQIAISQIERMIARLKLLEKSQP